MRISIPWGVLFAWLAVTISAPAATTLYVSPFGTNDVAHGYPDWAGAATNIQYALDLAVSNDTVWVTNAPYALTTNVMVTNAIVLRSWNDGELDPTNTILDGQGVTRCLYISNANALVAGFMIVNGVGTGSVTAASGGGVYIGKGALSNCVVTGNQALQYGGGVAASGSGALVTDCRIIGNTTVTNGVGGGGGIYLYLGQVYNSTICGNTSAAAAAYNGGGGLSINNGRVRGCVISNNYAHGYGGGLFVNGSATLVSNQIVDNISTNNGGGVFGYSLSASFLVAHCTISRNTDERGLSGGGGLYLWPTAFGGGLVTNCVISDNSAANFGGGIYQNVGNDTYTNTFKIANCVISGNRSLAETGNPAFRGGGGIYALHVGGGIENCVITGNVSASSAGGVWIKRTYVANEATVLRNCLVAANTARFGGGVVLSAVTTRPVRLENCTIVGNVATAYCGGLWFASGGPDSTMTNTICYSNTAPQDENIRTNTTGYAIGYSCTVPTNHLAGLQDGVITNAPLFVDTNTGNYRLLGESPGINTGANQDWMLNARDRDGTNARILYGRVDLGAYEYTTGNLSCTFVANPTWALAPSTNQFAAIVDGTNTDGLGYRWDFTNTSVPMIGNAIVTNVYDIPGYYSVALTVTNAGGEVAQFTNLCYIKAGPVTYYVATNGGNVFPYTNWAMAASNAIQAPVSIADNQDTVIVSNGTYVLSAMVGLNSGVLVKGLDGPANTIFDGNGVTRCFSLKHTNAVLSGVTVSNGRAAAAAGGGVVINWGIVSNCVIRNCRADRDGGGVYLYTGGFLRNSLIVTNVSSNGGGVCSYQTGLVQNCTIVGNVATNWSGGIYASSTGGVFQNCIIYSNYADSGIGPNWCTNNIGTKPPTRFVFTNCCTFPTNDLVGLGNISNEPAFLDYAAGNYRLAAGSPGVDAGANQDEWMLTGIDLDGQSRIFNTVVDIGAFERSLFDAAAVPTNLQASDGTYVDQVRVTWETNACTNAIGYQVFRSLAADPGTADQIGDAPDPSYADTSATNGVLYYYWVRATNAYAVSDLSVSNTGFRAIAPPTGVTASDGSYSGKVVVTWATNACTNATGYYVWRNDSNDAASALNLAAVVGTNYDDTSAMSNVSYYYWVQATNALGPGGTNSFSAPDTGYWAQWYYVATNGDDNASGIDWGAPLLTISNGVARAQRWLGGGVLVSNGTYNLSTNVNVTNAITVRGFTGREQTFVSGGGTTRCFYIHRGGIIDGFTISNGYNGVSASGGGGAYIDQTGYVYNCTFTNNIAYYFGGGLYINTGGLVTNCLFIGNMATNASSGVFGGGGGGIHIASQGVVSNCQFILNVAMSPNRFGGGGVYAAAGGKVYDSYFYTNTCPVLGGGANVQYLYNSTFISNSAGVSGGGGAYVLGLASNCDFTYNSAPGGYGGGCYVAAGAVAVNCTNISYNIGKYGGGVAINGTGLCLRIFNNSTLFAAGGVYVGDGGFLSNAVVYCNTNAYGGGGGGVYCINNCRGILDCVISNNVASGGYSGAGLRYQSYAGNTGLIQGCTFFGNSESGISYADGGGLWFREVIANIAVRRCVFINNTAARVGGGLYLGGNTGQVENCLIYSNRAASGGGVYMLGTNLLVNCTIISNLATSYGGGIYAAGAAHRVINTIVHSNNTMLYGTNNVAFSNCCLSVTNGLLGTELFTNAPALISVAGDNLRLGSGSPCIDAGTNQEWMAIDLDGLPRILGARVDLGAYEYPLYLQVSPLGITNTLITGISTGTLVEVWSGDTNVELNYAASSTNEWISLGVSNGVIAANTTNTLWVTNDSSGIAAGTYTGTVLVVATNSLSALYPPDTQAVTVIMTILPMGPPLGVQATDGEFTDKVVVTWDTNLCTNATGYAVWRSIAADTNSASILSAASGTSYTDTSATNSVIYYYWVQATNADCFSDLSVSNTGWRALAAPTAVSASDGIYSGKVAVTWTTNMCTNAAGYIVWRNTINDAASAANLARVAGAAYDDTSAASNILYYYWVQATNTLSQTNVSLGGPDSGYWAQTYYVATNGSDTNAGINWEMPYASISNAVRQAQRWMGGGVLVSNGEYVLSATVSITNGITVRGFNGREVTTVNGNNAVQCFTLNKTNAVLDGLTIAKGTNAYAAGAYLNPGRVFNCAFVSNASGSHAAWGSGGGALMMNGASRVTNCLFLANRRSGCGYNCGSAVYMAGVGGVLADCTIISNTAIDYYPSTVWLYEKCDVVVTGCTFAYNSNSSYAAVHSYSAATGRIDNCVFSNTAGGGVAYFGGKILMTNCTVIGNRGGGIAAMVNDTTVTDCRFIGNTFTDYTASAVSMGAGLLRNCVIRGNTNYNANFRGGSAVVISGGRMEGCGVIGNAGPNATSPGGTISMSGGVVSNCSILSNTCNYSGGLAMSGGTLINSVVRGNIGYLSYGGVYCGNATVRNCLIAGNGVGNWNGGGVYAINNATIQSCTIVSNTAGPGSNGGGIYVSGTNNLVQNCIIYSNAAAGVGKDLYLTTSAQSNLFSFCCTPVAFTNTANSNVTASPRLINWAGGDYRLAAGSPCINAGTNDVWMDTALDQGGRPRIRYGRVDIGCYEYFLNVKVNGVPIDRILRLNGVDQNRIIRINQ